MTARCSCVISEDIHDPVPDWGPYEQPKHPEGAPNVLYVVWDDVGFSAFNSFEPRPFPRCSSSNPASPKTMGRQKGWKTNTVHPTIAETHPEKVQQLKALR